MLVLLWMPSLDSTLSSWSPNELTVLRERGCSRIDNIFRICFYWASQTDLTPGMPPEMKSLLSDTLRELAACLQSQLSARVGIVTKSQLSSGGQFEWGGKEV